MYTTTLNKLAQNLACKLAWSGNHSIVISVNQSDQVLFTESDTGKNLEVFEKTETEKIVAAIQEFVQQGYILEN